MDLTQLMNQTEHWSDLNLIMTIALQQNWILFTSLNHYIHVKLFWNNLYWIKCIFG